VTDPISSWLIDNLDPSLGPLFTGLAGHWDTTRPALLLFFVAYLAFVMVGLHGVWRYFTR
jgi:hypothetical protein